MERGLGGFDYIPKFNNKITRWKVSMRLKKFNLSNSSITPEPNLIYLISGPINLQEVPHLRDYFHKIDKIKGFGGLSKLLRFK